jgi:hypothetical protein
MLQDFIDCQKTLTKAHLSCFIKRLQKISLILFTIFSKSQKGYPLFLQPFLPLPEGRPIKNISRDISISMNSSTASLIRAEVVRPKAITSTCTQKVDLRCSTKGI